MLDFVEEHSELQFEIAEGFPDYKPELPGGRPTGGRSLNAKPFDLSRLGEWRDRITSFPADFSNVGIDAETRARIHASVDNEAGDYCVAGTALIAGLLKGLLDLGVTPKTDARAIELIADGGAIVGVRIDHDGKDIRVRARAGVVLGTGGFEWDEELVEAFLRGPMHGPVSPPNNTGDGLRMAMAHGADLANMGEAWWVPIIQIPGDTFGGKPRSRSVRLERTRPRSIIVNRAGKRFLNEAGEYNSMAGPFHHLDPRHGYINDPAWIVFDSQHLKRYGFLGVDPDGPVPHWFCQSRDLAELSEKTGIDPDGLARTLEAWNENVAHEHDPDFGRGSSAYDGYWGDNNASTTPGKTLGPIDTAPYYAVPVTVGAMGTKGGPRTDRDGRVIHVSGESDPRAVRRGQRDGRGDRQGLRRSGRNHRPRNGFRLPRRIRRGDGQVGFLVRRAHGNVGPAAHVRHVHPPQSGPVDVITRNQVEQCFQRYPALHPGERGAEAAVDAVAEVQVVADLPLAIDVEAVGIGKEPFVAAWPSR